ncbi:uncharacterized protein EV154DRAFT_501190 [Mucor mucedo]|uniref:uncharacterized protein n=1 Tax=Mucor mucedo TaxID=29922 RepID=UPI002220AEA0|nr:uncharacterized protein EV154DRAFT_501190 [Mucor mucedo]KAI7893682.1 hypothetical protein EV154DRAFT_501190 [Mucor mucedo]
MQNVKTDDLFMKNDSSCSDDTNLLDTSDPGYILFFILAYLHNLNMLLNKELDKKFWNDWRGKNIWYGVSVDKHLLETVFVSKKKLEKLFYASGILLKDNNLRRAKFCVRGEDILPAIQQTLDLKLKMKSCFVVSQIFPQHVQLTLHQTVKLGSPGEDAASIIIEDKIVYFDDVYDDLCKNIWKKMQSNCQIDYCITHKDKKYTEYDFGSFQAYRDIRQTFKQRIVELLKNDSQNVDMNLCTKSNVNKKCSCHMVISLRLAIEKGLQPVIESIVKTIAATLTNYDIFGNYKTDYVFVLGDPFNLSYGSPLYAVYTTILQRAMDDGIHSKRKDAQAFVMKDSLDQLLHLFKSIKPHMFDRFINGTLCQVPSSTYGLRFYHRENHDFVRLNSNGVIKNFVVGRGHYLIFIEEGKPLSKTGMIFKITSCVGPGKQDSYVVVIKSRQSLRTKIKKYDLLDERTDFQRFVTESDSQGHFAYDIILDCKHRNYDYSLEFSIKKMDKFQSLNDYLSKFRVLGEPLTLAYI